MTSFFRIYFGDAATGTLQRLQFLGYWAALSLLVIFIGLGLGVLLGVSEHLVGGNIQEAQAILRERFAALFGIGLILCTVVFGYALINITAKRIRDIGLPAWPVVIVIIVVSGMAAQFAAENVQQGISTAEMLALLFIPSGAFGRNKPGAG